MYSEPRCLSRPLFLLVTKSRSPYKRRDDFPQLLGLRLGGLDTDPLRTVEEHIFTSSKVAWVENNDGLP